jgi:hypothetical protein
MKIMKTENVEVNIDDLTDRQRNLVKLLSTLDIWLAKLGYDFSIPADRDEFILFVNALLAAKLEMLNENFQQNESD